MKLLDKSTFFKELRLENLSNLKKDKIWQKFLELVSLEVLDKVLDKLPEKEQEKLFLDLANNPKKVDGFLKRNKKLAPIFNNAVSKIKKQIFSGFLKIQ